MGGAKRPYEIIVHPSPFIQAYYILILNTWCVSGSIRGIHETHLFVNHMIIMISALASVVGQQSLPCQKLRDFERLPSLRVKRRERRDE